MDDDGNDILEAETDNNDDDDDDNEETSSPRKYIWVLKNASEKILLNYLWNFNDEMTNWWLNLQNLT